MNDADLEIVDQKQDTPFEFSPTQYDRSLSRVLEEHGSHGLIVFMPDLYQVKSQTMTAWLADLVYTAEARKRIGDAGQRDGRITGFLARRRSGQRSASDQSRDSPDWSMCIRTRSSERSGGAPSIARQPSAIHFGPGASACITRRICFRLKRFITWLVWRVLS